MDRKNLVIKSKSSNSAITSKPDPSGGTAAHKKSWSSARFGGEVNSKKRGVYVEKKPANNTLSRVAQGPSDVPKAPKRARRGEKNFLNSCLSILSQETTATQFPETGNLKSGKARKAMRNPAAETVDKGTQDLDAIYSGSNSPVRSKPRRNVHRNSTPPAPPKPRKPRFRSKALNENFNDNRLVFLQHKRAFPRSPSMNSSGGIKSVDGRSGFGPERPSLLTNTSHENKIEDKKDDKKSERCDDGKSDLTIESKKKTVLKNNTPNVVASSVYDEVKSMATTESKKGKKVLRIEEPETLVSDYSAKNKSLYNFFVDLLETTCDVYNVQSNCKCPSPNFEIEDKVAQKLKINEPNTEEKNYANFEIGNKPQNIKNDQTFPNTINVPVNDAPKKLYFVTDDGVTDKIAVYQAGPICRTWNPPTMKPKRYRSPYKPGVRRPYRETYGNDYRSNLKSDSFRYAQQLKIQQAAKADSFMSPPKKSLGLKRNKKQSLLSLLKEELQLDDDYFEEPASFHQALSIIVRNKKRTQRAIHKDDSSVKFSIADRKSKTGSSDCFKRRKIISSSTRSPRKHKKNIMKSMKKVLSRDNSMAIFSEGPGRKYTANDSDESSVHSIEVDAYDYAPNQYVRRLDTNTNQMIYSSNSGVSLRSETITSSKDYIECLEKCGRSLSPPSGTASTAISQLLLRDVYNNDMF